MHDAQGHADYTDRRLSDSGLAQILICPPGRLICYPHGENLKCINRFTVQCLFADSMGTGKHSQGVTCRGGLCTPLFTGLARRPHAGQDPRSPQRDPPHGAPLVYPLHDCNTTPSPASSPPVGAQHARAKMAEYVDELTKILRQTGFHTYERTFMAWRSASSWTSPSASTASSSLWRAPQP